MIGSVDNKIQNSNLIVLIMYQEWGKKRKEKKNTRVPKIMS